jgi:hypothetical protein
MKAMVLSNLCGFGSALDAPRRAHADAVKKGDGIT